MKFFVAGDPVAKGSTKSFLHSKTGAMITHQTNRNRLYPWQQVIGYTAKQHGVKLTRDAVCLRLSFFMKRPKKPRFPFPVRGDLDKLVRAVLDSLSGIAYYDDRQVIGIGANKIYETERGIGVEIEVL